jgi:hypothetical protein
MWSTGSGSRAITVSTQGSYRVTVTGSNGCKATSNEILVKKNGCTPPPSPTITASGLTTIKSGESVTLTSSSSGGYLWSNGKTTRSITTSTPGIYTVRAYNGGGCYSTSLPSVVTVLQIRESSEMQSANTDAPSVSVYPNPSQDYANVVFNADAISLYNVKLIDITGKIVQEKSLESAIGENKIQFDLTQIPSGVYFAWVITGDQKEVVKVIVEHSY